MKPFSLFLAESSDRATFLHACFDELGKGNNLDKTTFLVFADFLEESGNDILAQFIRAYFARRDNIKGQKANNNRILRIYKNTLGERAKLSVTDSSTIRDTVKFLMNHHDYCEYYPKGNQNEFSGQNMDRYIDPPYFKANIPPNTIVVGKRIPNPDWPGGERYRNPNDPQNPANWSAPFMGEIIFPDEELLMRIFTGMMVHWANRLL